MGVQAEGALSQAATGGLTLVAKHCAAADTAATARGEGQEAAHLAREHSLAARVVTACRRREMRAPLWALPPQPCPGPGVRRSTASARPSPRMGSKMRSRGLASCCSR